MNDNTLIKCEDKYKYAKTVSPVRKDENEIVYQAILYLLLVNNLLEIETIYSARYTYILNRYYHSQHLKLTPPTDIGLLPRNILLNCSRNLY